MKFNTLSLGFIALLLVTSCAGQRFTTGQCPTFTPAALTLNVFGTAAGATWFEYMVTRGVLSQSLKCITLIIKQVTADVLYTYSATAIKTLTNTPTAGSGRIVPTGVTAGSLTASPSSYLTITGNRDLLSKGVRYQVVATDNAAYVVLYHCKKLAFGKTDSVIVLTNTATPAAAAITAINTALNTVGYQAIEPYQTFATGCA